MYRYADQYSWSTSRFPIRLETYYVVRETEHYAWVCEDIGPAYMELTKERFAEYVKMKYFRKVKKDARRSFCYFKKADAMTSYRMRKYRENKILTSRLETNEHIFKYVFGQGKSCTELVDEIDTKYKVRTLND